MLPLDSVGAGRVVLLADATVCFLPILLKNSDVAAAGLRCFTSVIEAGGRSMMGERQVGQEALFYGFSLECHVPTGHILRAIDRFVNLGELRVRLAPFYRSTGGPSIDPKLLIRMLTISLGGYGFRTAPESR